MRHLLWFSLLSLVLGSAQAGPGFERDVRLSRFYKGNTHTHSKRSDGDSAPEAVIRWYRDHGYGFLVMTDHNRASVPGEFKAFETDSFKVLAGEEVSYYSPIPAPGGSGQKNLPVHVNSVCSTRTIGGAKLSPVQAALQLALDRIESQGGAIAQINHPNYEWAISYSDLMGTRGGTLVEVANQHPEVRNDGDSSHPSVEALWDHLLTSGRWLFGVASDDMHDLVSAHGETPRRPGRGWVQVAATDLSEGSICQALARGDFYFGNGVELEAIEAVGPLLSLRVHATESEAAAIRTEFIGAHGSILATVNGSSPSYSLRGDEGYVRARVQGPGKRSAWTQPIRVLTGP